MHGTIPTAALDSILVSLIDVSLKHTNLQTMYDEWH
jgi:hypothetical protein